MANRVVSGSSLCLHCLLKSRTEAAALTRKSSLFRNECWDDISDLFCIKIAMDLGRAFLMLILLTVLSPDFLNSGGENKHDVSGRFRHFDSFFMFASFDDTIFPSD